MVLAKVQEWKGRPAIRLSKRFIEDSNLHIGDRIVVKITKVRKDGFGMLNERNLPSFVREHDDRGF